MAATATCCKYISLDFKASAPADADAGAGADGPRGGLLSSATSGRMLAGQSSAGTLSTKQSVLHDPAEPASESPYPAANVCRHVSDRRSCTSLALLIIAERHVSFAAAHVSRHVPLMVVNLQFI